METNYTDTKREIREVIKQEMPKYLSGTAFSQKKITDNPTDALDVVNRRYVTLNGTTRPQGSVMGQQFIDMNLAAGRGKPIYWNGIGWIDATGTYV